MTQPLILLNDRTSHNGVVISCAVATESDGRGFARVGDKVSCRHCSGVYAIVEGDPSLIVDGRAVAYHGCKTSCGAVLLSSQVVTITDPSGGAAPGTGSSPVDTHLPKGFGAIGGGLMATYYDELVDGVKQRFRGRFQVLDADSGEPVSGQHADVRSTGGQVVTARTDSDGFTSWVERDASEALSFQLRAPGA